MDKFGKPKQNISDQVNVYMKKDKGILFNEIDELEAIQFLTNNSYLFKVKSYLKNYDKKPNGKYINVEFAYLKELSTLDMYIRRYILKISLDIEHSLKTKLMRDISLDDSCDGYEIVDKFLENNYNLKNYFIGHKQKLDNGEKTGFSAKDNIIKKYGVDLSAWNLIEILEFGNFINFCKFYYKDNDANFNDIKNNLESIRIIRNESAHNNCIIHNLTTQRDFRPSYNLIDLLKDKIDLSQRAINKKMKIPTINNIVSLLFVYQKICNSKKMKKASLKEIVSLLKKIKRKEKYFIKNSKITSSYFFIVKAFFHFKKFY